MELGVKKATNVSAFIKFELYIRMGVPGEIEVGDSFARKDGQVALESVHVAQVNG